MARLINSTTKLSKRVGRNLYLKSRSFSAKDDYAKRPYKSGMHGGPRSKPSRTSEYGKQLLEKQAIRFTYGLMEKQLSRIFKKAFKKQGDTGKIALTELERRLDNVVYKGGLANSRAQARQLVNHGHFYVNNQKVDIPSYTVSAGDIITINTYKQKKEFWKSFSYIIPKSKLSWIDTSKKNQLTIISLPTEADLPQDFNISAVVEFYSRKVA